MKRRDACAALILLPAALIAVPVGMGEVARLVAKVTAQCAEVERQLQALEQSWERTGRKFAGIRGHADELPVWVLEKIEQGRV